MSVVPPPGKHSDPVTGHRLLFSQNIGMCHSGCRRHKETLFSCGPSVHCRAKQGRGGLQSDCLGSSLDFETAIQMHICWFELCPFKTVGKRHWMTLKPDWIYDCSKESRIFSFCGQPAISVHQWTDECLLFSNNTVMTWLSSCFSFSIYHEGLQSFGKTKVVWFFMFLAHLF